MCQEKDYLIVDDLGVIHSGTESEMTLAFEMMTDNFDVTDPDWMDDNGKTLDEYLNEYYESWHGELLLVHVVKRHHE